jgi:hypothetical protein
MHATPDDLERILKKNTGRTAEPGALWPNSNQAGPAIAFLEICKQLVPDLVFTDDADRVDWMEGVGTLEFSLSKFQPGEHLKSLGIKFHVFQDLHRLAKKAWRGPGKAGARPLPFIRDKELRETAERDLASFESARKADETKSAVVLAGSVIEAILFDLTEKDPVASATAAGKVKAKYNWKKFDPTDQVEWTLFQVIAVCGPDGLAILSERTEATAHVARDYRNFVHPRKEREEIRAGTPLTAPDAAQAGALMEMVIDQVTRWRSAHP